ncbi:hypothetical protein [Blastococcus saxobsidens]|uniref:Uncharacterized protein n=1 Tax=Blastococcus saxobsidens (strain DD2) TaxID=1146883 RepID=H6RQ41_BLASD|nr:hypothetical protein [Blastococcus saxobsidens]CCG02810.1 exported protein of unknown function [Blastococcus saxobsidens DD2]
MVAVVASSWPRVVRRLLSALLVGVTTVLCSASVASAATPMHMAGVVDHAGMPAEHRSGMASSDESVDAPAASDMSFGCPGSGQAGGACGQAQVSLAASPAATTYASPAPVACHPVTDPPRVPVELFADEAPHQWFAQPDLTRLCVSLV